MSIVLPILLVIANVMGAGMIAPQVVRLHRLRTVEGLSGAWVGIGVGMNNWWSAYGLAESLWGILPVSITASVLYVVMAFQYFGIVGRRGLRPLLWGMIGFGLFPVPFLVAGGWEIAGVAIGLCYGVQFLPAAYTSVRSADLSGVSPVTWTMAFVEAVIWVTYGLYTGDKALLIGGTGGSLASGIILCRLLYVATTRARPASG
ncbi:MAG: hypothetical protein ACK5O2_04065 [Microthrixaceae bacterium]